MFQENQLHTTAGHVSEYESSRSLLTGAHSTFLSGWGREKGRERSDPDAIYIYV
jgi:hypothetical protein